MLLLEFVKENFAELASVLLLMALKVYWERLPELLRHDEHPLGFEKVEIELLFWNLASCHEYENALQLVQGLHEQILLVLVLLLHRHAFHIEADDIVPQSLNIVHHLQEAVHVASVAHVLEALPLERLDLLPQVGCLLLDALTLHRLRLRLHFISRCALKYEPLILLLERHERILLLQLDGIDHQHLRRQVDILGCEDLAGRLDLLFQYVVLVRVALVDRHAHDQQLEELEDGAFEGGSEQPVVILLQFADQVV